MDPRFAPHNTHLEDPASFATLDPQLRALSRQPLVHRFGVLDRVPTSVPGVYSITGGRQVGKTTVTKQWMAELLDSGVRPERIAYLTGELIDDHHALVQIITDVLRQPARGRRYIVLDEVTYVRDWDKGVKYLADAGMLESTILLLTGSDSVLIRDARSRMPGRRGRSQTVDFHLFPLSFHDYVVLADVVPSSSISSLVEADETIDADVAEALHAAFESYLAHGGYLMAINDVARDGTIQTSTFATYSDWVRGDVLKRGKHERYLKEVLESVVRREGSQVTWNALAKELSIDHPMTVADYVGLLERMDVLTVRPALREHTLSPAPKKARKVGFSDPFIRHALSSWLQPSDDPWSQHVTSAVEDPDVAGVLVESCAASHFARHYPTYYIKGAGEVDIAYVEGKRFHPIEVKWAGQVRPGDLKQLSKYSHGVVATRLGARGSLMGVRSEMVPLLLLRLGPSPVSLVER